MTVAGAAMTSSSTTWPQITTLQRLFSRSGLHLWPQWLLTEAAPSFRSFQEENIKRVITTSNCCCCCCCDELGHEFITTAWHSGGLTQAHPIINCSCSSRNPGYPHFCTQAMVSSLMGKSSGKVKGRKKDSYLWSNSSLPSVLLWFAVELFPPKHSKNLLTEKSN